MAPILPLSEIPTLSLLYKLGRLFPPPPALSLPEPSECFNGIISLVNTDITTLQTSAIVNAANKYLLGGGGVDGAIHAKAGPHLYDECKALGGCETGSAKITSAYDLPCDKVIHAVGPMYWRARRERPGLQKELLAGCYRQSLDLAQASRCKSVAFSSLSTGVYGYPNDEAAQVAIAEVRRWLQENWTGTEDSLTRIVFCCYMVKDMEVYEEWLPKFFPPTESDISKADQKHDKLVNTMPDPPANEPLEEGEPSTKKKKIALTKNDDDWEVLDKTFNSAENGFSERELDSAELDAIEAQIAEGEAKENQATALHTLENGGVLPNGSIDPL